MVIYDHGMQNYEYTHMHRHGGYSRSQARLPAASSLARSLAYVHVYYHRTSYPPVRWLRPLAERVLLLRASVSFFVWALPTHSSFHFVLLFRPFFISSLESIRVCVVTETVRVRNEVTPLRTLFISVKYVHPLDAVRRSS